MSAFDFQCPVDNQRNSTTGKSKIETGPRLESPMDSDDGGWVDNPWEILIILSIVLGVLAVIVAIPIMFVAGCTFGCLNLVSEFESERFELNQVKVHHLKTRNKMPKLKNHKKTLP